MTIFGNRIAPPPLNSGQEYAQEVACPEEFDREKNPC